LAIHLAIISRTPPFQEFVFSPRNLFLEEVSNDFREYFIIILVDGAGGHRSHDLKVPENIRLIQQPSHSPELNPVEHL
jgi:hypothetical protein